MRGVIPATVRAPRIGVMMNTTTVTATKTRHAVLTSDTLMINEGRRIRKVKAASPSWFAHELYDLVRSAGVTHVWIMPDVPVNLTVPPDFDVFATYEDEENTRPMFARIYRKGVYGEVKIGWPDNGDWRWDIAEPVNVLAAIWYLEQELGIPVEWSPGHMGTELVKHLNRTQRRAEWVRDTIVDLFKLPFKRTSAGAGGDLKWKTGHIADIERGHELETAIYIHQFDKRSGYLSACGDLYVGAGDPVHITGSPIDTTLPGVYRVSILDTAGSPFDDRTLPSIVAAEWVTADVLRYATQKGYSLSIHEAYQWEEKHKTLASYAEKLWSGRRAFREKTEAYPHKAGRENAENTMKAIALVATGKFASEKKSGRFRQPYWWSSVVGKMRVLTLANILKIFINTGLCPALLYCDSVYYVTAERDPQKAVPGIFDCGRKDGLGAFRHEGTWKVTPEMIEQFKTEKPGSIQKYLEHTEKEVTI